MKITKETRRKAYEEVDKTKRYHEILQIFKKKKYLTAKECAVRMYNKGWIPTSERNFTAPRFTELVDKKILMVVKKEKCKYTGKTVAVYTLR